MILDPNVPGGKFLPGLPDTATSQPGPRRTRIKGEVITNILASVSDIQDGRGLEMLSRGSLFGEPRR